jgi:hypothetical protein
VRGVEGTYAERKIPYRLPALRTALAADPNTEVHVAEGEKDVDTLTRLGFVATTNPGGAQHWTEDLTAWLRTLGVNRVVIHEDNDEAGRSRATKLTATFTSFASVRIVRYSDVPEGEDVTWWLEHGHTREELEARIAAAPPGNGDVLDSVRASSIEMEALDWLWPERFARGKIGIITGLPDEGKGQLLAYIAARCTRDGLEWPNSEGHAPLGNVLLLTAEDDPKDTVVPRLVAAGADLERIEIIKMVHERDPKSGQGRTRIFSLITDLEKLRRKVAEIGDVVLILIDPISAYLGVGKVDSFRDADVRAVLTPLKELGEELRIAIIAVMHFNKKADVVNMMLRISNSIAFAAASRHAFGIVDDPENDRKLLVRGKNNLARKDDRALAFRFDQKEVGRDRRTDRPILAPFIVWEEGYVDITATEALQAVNEHKAPGARDSAKGFLELLLADGPIDAKDVHDAAHANGITPRTLRRAKDLLGVEIKKDGPPVNGQRGWRWHLHT